jgi:hypothetical protein
MTSRIPLAISSDQDFQPRTDRGLMSVGNRNKSFIVAIYGRRGRVIIDFDLIWHKWHSQKRKYLVSGISALLGAKTSQAIGQRETDLLARQLGPEFFRTNR